MANQRLLKHKTIEWDGVTRFPPRLWAKDHWSTLLYFEDVAVNGGGYPVMERMRQEPGRPRRGKALGQMSPPSAEARYPTRMVDGAQLLGHDDWDCADDIEAAGMITTEGTGLVPRVKLTPYGFQVASALRQHLANCPPGARSYVGFRAPTPPAEVMGEVP